MARPPEWRELHWRRPLAPELVADCLRQWASDGRAPLIALETQFTRGSVRQLIGFASSGHTAALSPLRGLERADIRPADGPRPRVVLAGRLRASTRHRPLRLNDPESLTRALYQFGLQSRGDDVAVLQVLLGPRRVPLAVPNASPSSVVQPWWSVAWMGNGGQIDGEKRSALRAKVGDHGFAATVRLGVRAGDPARARTLLLGLLAAIRVSEAPGLRLRLHREPPRRLNTVAVPRRWPLRLGVAELTALTGWPLGDQPLPGVPSDHPRLLPPPPGTTGHGRVIADVTLPGSQQQLTQSTKGALLHTHVIGPTGVGKSTLMSQLILQDLSNGANVVVIEPKGDLVRDVLARLPQERLGDAVIIDPSDETPVGLNPLHSHGRRPDLVADSVLSVLKQLYGKNIGPRSSDILYAGLLTLTQRADASLVMLPLLLTNPGFRRSLTSGLRDPLVLEPFWAGFERWSDAERSAAIGPALNKLRPLLRPGLRGVLGQRRPRFDLSSVFSGSSCLFVPLRRGVIGAEASDLLGSILVSELWQAIQARAAVPSSRRRPVVIYIDEAQSYLRLPVDLADALAQARGYAAAFVIAHQYLGQFSRDMRSAVLANARSRIVFQTTAEDARILERGHPELSADDLTSLGHYELYASLYAAGKVQPYASGRSRPLAAPTMSVPQVLRQSRQRWGQPLDEIESAFAAVLASNLPADQPTGRRARRPS